MNYINFEEARLFARNLELEPTKESWTEYCKYNQIPDGIPIQPDQRYRRSGWKNWKDFLMDPQKRYLPFDEAREFVKALGLKTNKEWQNYSAGYLMDSIGLRPKSIPADPELRYRHEWKGMRYWLGLTEVHGWLPYNEALKLVQEKMQEFGYCGQIEWKKLRKSEHYPDGVPTDPVRVYGEQCNISDWYCNKK